MSEFDSNKPEPRHEPHTKSDNSLQLQDAHQNGPQTARDAKGQGVGNAQPRDLFNIAKDGDAGIGQGRGNAGDPISHADLVRMPEKPSVANALARDTIDTQLFASGMRRVTPMEITVNGQNFNGSVSHDRDGNRFITDGRNTYRIFPGDARHPHGFIQLSRDSQPQAIQGQKVTASGESAFRQPGAGLKLPESVAGNREKVSGLNEARQQTEPKSRFFFQLPEQVGQAPHGKDLANLFKAVQNSCGADGKQQLDFKLAGQFTTPQAREAFAELLAGLRDGKVPPDNASPQGKALQELGKFLGTDGLTQMRQLLLETQGNVPPRFDTKFDLPAQGLLREFVDLLSPTMKRPEGSLQVQDKPVSPMAQLLEIFRFSDRQFNSSDSTQQSLKDIGKSIRDFNSMMGLDGTTGAITIRDLFGRNIDASAREFAVKSAPDAVLMVMLDRLGQARNESRAEAQARSELVQNKPDATQASLDRDNRSPLSTQAPELHNFDGDDGNTAITTSDAAARALGLSAGLDPKKQQLDLAEQERRLQEEQEKSKRKKQEGEDSKNENAELAATILANTRKPKNDEEIDKDKEKQDAAAADKNKKDQDKRQRYIVREGDTLESIAIRMLRDKRLASLIYEINKTVIPIVEQDGKRLAELKPQLVIYLPNLLDIRDYRVRLASEDKDISLIQSKPEQQFANANEELAARFGTNWDSRAREGYQARRENIESYLGPLTTNKEQAEPPLLYTVRLGDSLKSIAMKHSNLNDITLWKLLASVNNLSAEVDTKGVPLSTLKRGQRLTIPSAEEIREFRRSENERTKGMPMTLAAANARRKSISDRSEIMETMDSAPREARFESSQAEMPIDVELLVKDFSQSARLLQQKHPEGASIAQTIVLETRVNDTDDWSTVVIYEIRDSESIRHEFSSSGFKKTIRIDLPPLKVLELAHNDITAHWAEYCNKYHTAESN